MFRRTKSESPAASEQTPKPGGKGRPTPTRKEAEAAARARAKVPRTRREMAAAQKANRAKSRTDGNKVREAMKTGDDRYLPARDRGPVRRFIRDYVDTRFSFIELVIPIMIVTLVMGWSGNAYLVGISEIVLLGAIVMVVMEMVFLRMRLRKELANRFPEEPVKGTTYYAVTRAMQMKFMRLPKPQRKIGESLPDTYR